MLLSVCIPIYNSDVRPLVRSLAAQAAVMPGEVEIVCMDDGSEPSYHAANSELADVARYTRLPHNIGRARIRNRLAASAQGRYLLFLDADVRLPDALFLQRYTDYAASRGGEELVVCGGHRYKLAAPPDRRHRLKYLYGTRVEAATSAQRGEQPNRAMKSSNFMISRRLMEEVPFDERLTTYGHEDTLMGYRLARRGVAIGHIENPVVIGEVDDNATFMRKSDEAVANLAMIYGWTGRDPDFAEQVRLLRAYERLRRCHAVGCVKAVFTLLGGPTRSLLCAGCASNRLFAFYKLGRLCLQLDD